MSQRRHWAKGANRSDEDALRDLLQTACVELGFCGNPAPLSPGRLLRQKPISASQFAAEVMQHEGLDPTLIGEHFKALEQAFEERFGPVFPYAPSDKDSKD